MRLQRGAMLRIILVPSAFERLCIRMCYLQFYVAGMALLILVSLSGARAQSPSPGDVNQLLLQQRQILQQQEERRQRELEKLREGQAPKKMDRAPDDAPPALNGKCARVNKIVFDGAELLADDTRKALQKPFVGSCMSIVDIGALVRAVTNWYVDQGYVTARAYPPEQDLSKAILTIRVIEGRTESVEIFENGEPRQGANTAFPELVGNRLYIRDLEQGLDQINRLPSHDATIRLEEGGKDGYSRVRVDTRKAPFPFATTAIDNSGLTSTGELQAGSSVYLDDVFGLYDSWVLSYKSSDMFYEGQKASKEFTASVSLPYGYWTLLLSGSYFDYRTRLIGETATFKSDGLSRYYTAELDRVLHRDRDSKTRLTGFINFKDTENFIEDVRLETGSRKLNVTGLRLSHDQRTFDGLLNASISGHKGVPIFGSLSDDDSLPGSPVAAFSKVSAEVGFYRPFTVDEFSLAWNAKAYGPWSHQDLFSTEQISLGSQFTVRGFKKDQSLSGDTGAYVRNELIWMMHNFLPEETKPYLGRLDLFAAYDAGWLKDDELDPFEQGSVSGIAAGARLSGGYLFGEMAFEKPLDVPEFIDEQELFRFQAGMSLKW